MGGVLRAAGQRAQRRGYRPTPAAPSHRLPEAWRARTGGVDLQGERRLEQLVQHGVGQRQHLAPALHRAGQLVHLGRAPRGGLRAQAAASGAQRGLWGVGRAAREPGGRAGRRAAAQPQRPTGAGQRTKQLGRGGSGAAAPGALTAQRSNFFSARSSASPSCGCTGRRAMSGSSAASSPRSGRLVRASLATHASSGAVLPCCGAGRAGGRRQGWCGAGDGWACWHRRLRGRYSGGICSPQPALPGPRASKGDRGPHLDGDADGAGEAARAARLRLAHAHAAPVEPAAARVAAEHVCGRGLAGRRAQGWVGGCAC